MFFVQLLADYCDRFFLLLIALVEVARQEEFGFGFFQGYSIVLLIFLRIVSEYIFDEQVFYVVFLFHLFDELNFSIHLFQQINLCFLSDFCHSSNPSLIRIDAKNQRLFRDQCICYFLISAYINDRSILSLHQQHPLDFLQVSRAFEA